MINQIKKLFSYVDRNIFVKRWIEPNDVTRAIWLLFMFFLSEYSSWSSDFFYGLYVLPNNSNFTSKESTMCKFVFISTLKPALLKISIRSFRMRSIFCFYVFLKTTSPSSLNNPVDCLSSLSDIKAGYQQARRFR